MARVSVQLSQFKFRVCHLTGKKNSAADAISRTENLPTDALTAEAEARYEDDILDFQLMSGHMDVTTTRDVGTQCNLNTCTPRQDAAITAVQTRATHGSRQRMDGATKPRTHTNTRKIVACNTLTGNDVTSSNTSSNGSNDSSSETSNGSSGGKDGDRRTATDGDFGNAEISLLTKARHTIG